MMSLILACPFHIEVELKQNHLCLLQAVTPGATIFVGQYLFTGSETTSVWLEVIKAFFIAVPMSAFCLFHMPIRRIWFAFCVS
jgi:hypothetical protein